jgi:hypothetical protein
MNATITTTERTYECPAGLRMSNGAASLWVRSPRTGVTVIVMADRFAALPARLIARVTKFISEGRHGFAFTRPELLAIAEAAKPAPVAPAAEPEAAPAVEPSPATRRAFWGTPSMSKTEAAPVAAPSTSVEPVAPAVHRVPVSFVGYGIEGRMRFIRIVLPSGPVEFSWQDWYRLSPALLGRLNAGADTVEMTDAEIAAVVEAQAGAAQSIARNTGTAKSTRARKG